MEMYKFVGKGAGVPGLPHTLSREEAKKRGVEEILDAAIDNGNYEQIGGRKKSDALQDDINERLADAPPGPVILEPKKPEPKKKKGLGKGAK